MGIRVCCSNGHVFKVKDKYAGKTGRCPHCKGKVSVPRKMAKVVAAAHDSVLDDDPDVLSASGSMSLLGSRIPHKEPCPKCGTKVIIWHCKCHKCGHFFENR